MAQPIYVSGDDTLSQATADEIRAHNETGAVKCKWKKRSHGKVVQ